MNGKRHIRIKTTPPTAPPTIAPILELAFGGGAG
jgi:hypothetical protein